MTKVEIDIDKLGSAISAAESLAQGIDSQRHIATNATPIALPTLGDDTLGKTSRWLTDNLAELQTRRDLAVLLDRDDTGHASYEVSSDSLTNVQQMLGEELSQQAEDLGYDADAEEVERFASIMANWQDNPEVMKAMYLDLGPEGVVGVMSNIDAMMQYSGVDYETMSALAERIRSGLSTATEAPDFPGEEYGRELTRYAVAPLLTTDEQSEFRERFDTGGMNGANILTFLMQDHTYSDDFLLGAGRQLDDFERLSRDGFMPAEDWYSHNSRGGFDTGKDGGYYDDPMAAIMHNFGDNPEAGLTFFTEPTADDWNRQTFYFNDREWKADGYGGISHAAQGIGTSEVNLRNHPEETTHLVSSFLDQVANSDGFNAEDAKPASPYVADLLKFYMPAVDNALRIPNGDGTAGTTTLDVEHLGSLDPYPIIFTDDLDSLMQVSMSTQDGTQRIAEGIGTYQQTLVNDVAAQLADDPNNPDLRSELRDIVQRGAALQGFGEYSVGQVDIDAAANRDAQRQAFIDLVGDAAGLVPLPGADAVGEVGSKLIDFGVSHAIDLGNDAAGDTFASEAAAATDNANDRADAGSNRVKLSTFLTLVRAGVIPRDEVPDKFYDNGSLIDPGSIQPEQMSSFVGSAMDGVNDYASSHDLEDAYKEEFSDYYQSQ